MVPAPPVNVIDMKLGHWQMWFKLASILGTFCAWLCAAFIVPAYGWSRGVDDQLLTQRLHVEAISAALKLEATRAEEIDRSIRGFLESNRTYLEAMRIDLVQRITRVETIVSEKK